MSQKTVMSFEIVSAARKTSEHVAPRHIVAALLDPSGDPPQGQLRRGDPQIYDFDSPTGRFPTLQPRHVRQPAQRALEREIRLGSRQPIELAEKQSTGGERGQLGP
jgi:hypothetical protein